MAHAEHSQLEFNSPIPCAQAAEYVGFDRVLVPCAVSNSTYRLAPPYVDAYTLETAVMGSSRNMEVLWLTSPGYQSRRLVGHVGERVLPSEVNTECDVCVYCPLKSIA